MYSVVFFFALVFLADALRLSELRIAASGMAWMGNDTKRVVTLSAGDIKWAMWMRVARNHQVRVGLKGDRQRETFDGFTRDVCLFKVFSRCNHC